jgi:hypothetical protein
MASTSLIGAATTGTVALSTTASTASLTGAAATGTSSILYPDLSFANTSTRNNTMLVQSQSA